MLDFAALAAQMDTALDAETWQPESLLQALQATQNFCAGCSERGDFNALLADATQKGTIPEMWHPARLLDDTTSLAASITPVAAPLPHFVATADGSQIYPDTHEIADCYLLNVSGVALRYGSKVSTEENALSNAQMDSSPQFYSAGAQDAWHGSKSDDKPREAAAVNRELVDARRHVAELDELARLLEDAPQIPAIGLCDGIFDLRVAATHSWRDFALSENNRALDALRQCGHPIAGYIAASRAGDVITGLRVALSEIDKSDSETDAALARLIDVRLFDALLKNGERSATFVSGRNFSGKQYMSSAKAAKSEESDSATSRHATCFFYLKIDDGNVARLEFPRWVAEPPGWIELLHALTLSQIEKGGGYPVALMEAHEHAVVRGTERELFYLLLEERMAARGWQPQRSAKNLSKSRPLV